MSAVPIPVVVTNQISPMIEARVAGLRVFLSRHAAIRYQQRVRPGLPLRLIAQEWKSLVENYGQLCAERPDWAYRPLDAAETLVWIVAGDVAFPVCNPDGSVLTTFVRGGISDVTISRRRARRRERTALRAVYREQERYAGRSGAGFYAGLRRELRREQEADWDA